MTEAPLAYPLTLLIGIEISSVEFVRDYIVLNFDGPSLTILTDPLIIVNDQIFDRNSPEYDSLLINCINFVVKDVALVEKEFIKMFLSNNIIIHISLRPEDYVVPEAAIYFDRKAKIWEYW